MAKQKPKDMFMQFASIRADFGSPTSTLVESVLNTGLSVRGGLMWLIHQVEFMVEMQSILSSVTYIDFQSWATLSTRRGLGAQPLFGDVGILAQDIRYVNVDGNAVSTEHLATMHRDPRKDHFLPPFPLAAPSVSLYINTSGGITLLQDAPVIARIGYTTAPLDEASYAEIAETWGYAG